MGDNSYVCRSYRGKTCMGGGATPPYWIGLREYHDILSDNYFNCKSKDALRTFSPRVLQGHVLPQFQGHQILSWNTFTLVSKFHWVCFFLTKKIVFTEKKCKQNLSLIKQKQKKSKRPKLLEWNYGWKTGSTRVHMLT